MILQLIDVCRAFVVKRTERVKDGTEEKMKGEMRLDESRIMDQLVAKPG